MKITEKVLLAPKDFAPSFANLKVEGVFNPGAIRMPNGKIMLLARVAESSVQHNHKSVRCPIVVASGAYRVHSDEIAHDQVLVRRGNGIYLKNGTCRLLTLSHLRKAVVSEDGFEVQQLAEKPSFTGTTEEGQFGVEDPRLAKIGNTFKMTYVTVSLREGVSTSLAVSTDLSRWQRKGIIFREQNKDVVLFPERINGKFVALHRPEGFFKFSKPSIWISYSPDLVYWGREKTIIYPRENSWEGERIGAGAPPIKTREGWLVVYHGVRKNRRKKVYSAGAVLLNSKNPEKIIARSPADTALLCPNAKFERNGFINHVVFPSGAILDENKKDLLLYCGGADRVVSVKKIALRDILNHMEFQ